MSVPFSIDGCDESSLAVSSRTFPKVLSGNVLRRRRSNLESLGTAKDHAIPAKGVRRALTAPACCYVHIFQDSGIGGSVLEDA